MSRLSGEMAMFCEHCGIHRDQLGDESVAPIRECRACHRAICPNCWNLVVDACLRCAPFGLSPIAGRVPVVIPKTAADNAGLTSAAAQFVGEPSVERAAVTPNPRQSGAATKPKRPRRIKPAAAAAASAVPEPSWPTHLEGPRIRDRTDQVHWDPLPQPSTVGGQRLAVVPRHVGISGTGVAAVAVAVVAVGMLAAVFGSGPGTLAGGAQHTAPAPTGVEAGAGRADASAGPVTRVSSGPTSAPTANDVVLIVTPEPHATDPPTNPSAATSPAPTSTASAQPTGTAGATPTATADPTATPTAAPTPTPTPTAAPTPDPTPEPTPDPTPHPTPEPTPEPTPVPTPEPTPDPTPEPTPDPTPDPTVDQL